MSTAVSFGSSDHPNCPFPIHMVDRVADDGQVQIAKRLSGDLLHRARLNRKSGDVSWDSLEGTGLEVVATAQWLQSAFFLLGGEEDISLPVLFFENHCLLIDVVRDGDRIALGVDTGLAMWVAKHPESRKQAADLLGSIVIPELAATVLGRIDAKGAVRNISKRYASLSTADCRAIHTLLDGTVIDSGSVASAFLKRVVDFSRREAAGIAEVDWLDRLTTWMRGQSRIDLPYDRSAVDTVLADDLIDPDEARALLYQIVRPYDRNVEKENIARVSGEVRLAGQELIFGRMSRAFHNQALLFAHSATVEVSEGLRAASKLVSEHTVDIPALRPHADLLSILVDGDSRIALTNLEGALERLESAVVEYQKEAIQDVLSKQWQSVEDRSQAVGTMSDSKEKSRQARDEIIDTVTQLLDGCQKIREELLKSQCSPAAYVVISQRPSPTGSHLLAKINEAEDPYLGKAENLTKLVRQAGHRVYSSPDYGWLERADHWVEAIPLFIKEQVTVVDGAEVTETVIDQAGMEESFREAMSDHWAANIEDVMASEHLALARDLLLAQLHTSSESEKEDGYSNRQKAVLKTAREQIDPQEIRTVAAAIEVSYWQAVGKVHAQMEREGIDRYQALHSLLLSEEDSEPLTLIAQAMAHKKAGTITSIGDGINVVLPTLTPEAKEKFENADLHSCANVWRTARQTPTLHVLTTQSARMTDGYIRSWIEESMALRNVVRDRGLAPEVRERISAFDARILSLGTQLIRELGMWVEVEEIAVAQGFTLEKAALRVVAASRTVQQELSLLATLQDIEGVTDGEPPGVERVLESNERELAQAVRKRVIERNKDEIRQITESNNPGLARDDDKVVDEIIAANEEFSADLKGFMRLEARVRLLEKYHSEEPEENWPERARNWLRNHQRLAKTTARKEVISGHGLNHLTLNPFYYYQATGGNKKFHLLYTPSRVDLGERERESVESWAQWVGGLDEAAAQVGQRIYGLINKSVKRFDSLTEPEILKTGENASMAAHLAYSNAMALMVNASGRGDMEELGDQMSLRHDRLIHAAGEGYGGYCVPKDGLFLEFVLTLTQKNKLRQLGVSDEWHEGVVALAHHVMSERDAFESALEWEAWAAEILVKNSSVAEFFSTRKAGDDTPSVPVFQITKLASVLSGLGRPDLTQPARLTEALAARFGIKTMIAGAEHVNRFMAFYKAWLIHRALAQAREHDKQVPKVEEAIVILEAEYKPDTQDGRFSVGMRKLEIFAGTAQHLTYSLGTEAQDLVSLMFDGWETASSHSNARRNRLLQALDLHDTVDSELSKLYPPLASPKEVRLVSVMGLSTQDLLHYTSDTRIEETAAEVHARLMAEGMSEADIEANFLTYGTDLGRWAKLRSRPPEELHALQKEIGPAIHAAALASLGPDPSLTHALQGADVFDTGIPHKAVMELLDDPGRLRDLMMEGHPNSALAIVDGASGARRRAMNRLGVMRWFAVCDAVGRRGTYLSIGLGSETVEVWRWAMEKSRSQASKLYDALIAGDDGLTGQLFSETVSKLISSRSAVAAVEDEARLTRFGRDGKGDHFMARLLTEIVRNRSLKNFDFAHWLALGGLFILDGAPASKISQVRDTVEKALEKLGGSPRVRSAEEMQSVIDGLLRPQYVNEAVEFRQEGAVESSNKATEEVVSIAIDTRRQLAARAKRAAVLRKREGAYKAQQAVFAKAGDRSDTLRISEAVDQARTALGDGNVPVTPEAQGVLLACLQQAMLAGVDLFYPLDSDEAEAMRQRWTMGVTGREFDTEDEAWRAMRGGYEDIGDIGRLARAASQISSGGDLQKNLETVADLAELFDTAYLLDLTRDLAEGDVAEGDSSEKEKSEKEKSENIQDANELWRNIADGFAETINDHFYDYRPWAYSRGVGFDSVVGGNLLGLAERHHRWLYNYLRRIIVTKTEVANLSEADQLALLGDASDLSAMPIGGGTERENEKWWRCYNQLREIAFIRNDGFDLPFVFQQFDPDLIEADARVNMVALYPVGRTHVSRALQEGPTLNRELSEEGFRGANFIITRNAILENLGGDRAKLLIEDGHLYVSQEIFAEALMKHKKISAGSARELAGRKADLKGVRIAVRFSRPVNVSIVLPLHGHPLYTEGVLEEIGLPYATQSRFHTWTTYDKAKYPDIFDKESGVDIPAEMDWHAAYSSSRSDAVAKEGIENGDESLGFEGLVKFAEKHAIVMVKDAAESGGRNQKAFLLKGSSGELDGEVLSEAVEFIHQISLRNNVVVQEVIAASPEAWATEEFMFRFVERQIVEWGHAIERDRRPRTPLYGSHRLIVSTDHSRSSNDNMQWHISHPITLNSTQLITNIGRGGSLDLISPEDIRADYRDSLWNSLTDAAHKAMNAMWRYESRSGTAYQSETGYEIGVDSNGLSYGFPRYLMLDFLVTPRFRQPGIIVDWTPALNKNGVRIGTDAVLEHEGERYTGEIIGWKVTLIEPNIGVGLWDRVAIREEAAELEAAKCDGRDVDPDNIGKNARIVLRDFALAGQAHLLATDS